MDELIVPARGSAARAGRILAFYVLAMLAVSPAAYAQKDTPFGVELVPANFPLSTIEDTLDALALTASVGSHSSFIWHWGERPALDALTHIVPLMHSYGLKSLVQMGTIFLGDPAPPEGFVKSFADPQVRALFLSDVARLAQLHPDYMVLTTEVNLMFRFNRPEFEHFRGLYQEAYALAKSISPQTQIGVSYLESLWFAQYYLDGDDVPSMIAPADFVAFTAYPEWLVREGHFASIADIPPEWHGYSRTAYPDAVIIFSEVGWASKGRGTPEAQAEYLRNLPRLMSTARPALVTWALLADVEFFTRDLLSDEAVAFLEGLGVDIDTLFEHFNGMGLLEGSGAPKPSFAEAEALDFGEP